MTRLLLTTCVTLTISTGLAGQLPIAPASTLSEDHPTPSMAPDPGTDAHKARLLELFKTPGGVHDGRLVVVYGDANSTESVWDPRGKTHAPRDIFVKYSDDAGSTWSNPVNVSNTADKYSARTDWNADGTAEIYWGDSAKPTVFGNGDSIVVTWADKYAPEPGWSFGQSGQSALQGTISYPDYETYPLLHVVPYAAIYAAISYDGGTTWAYGHTNPPLQITYGLRDAWLDGSRGSGANWVMIWQEDPEGLQPGEAEGPGEGSSGAKTTKGTDVWYSYTTDLANAPLALRDNRQPLSNNSAYDLTTGGAFPMVGPAGSIENHGAARPNLGMLKDGSLFKTIIAYEETKGQPEIDEGKTIQLHVFRFDQPVRNGAANQATGDTGTLLSDPRENSRRVRFAQQQPNGSDPALAVFWRQGLGSEGAPADIVLKSSTSLDPALIAAAPLLNISSNTPTATMANLGDGTGTNRLEDSKAHRAFIDGRTLILGYTYTPNGLVARYTDLENYDFWIRRSLDGGQTWLAPQNLSNLPTKQVTVIEPRLVGPTKTGNQAHDAFVVGWGTETNVYEGLEVAVPLDLFLTWTHDNGATFEPLTALAATGDEESEMQVRLDATGTDVNAVWMDRDPTTATTDVRFATNGPARHVFVNGSPATPGADPLRIEFHAPDAIGAFYVAGMSRNTNPGIATPYGVIPLTDDYVLQLSLTEPSEFVGFQGTIGAAGLGFGAIVLPNLPALHGKAYYVAFVTIPLQAAWGISEAVVIRFE